MNTWLMLLMVVAIAAAAILSLSFVSSLVITRAAKRYLQKQQRQDTQWILGLLPGKDCKACGQESCSAYARQIAEDHGFCSDCPWMDNTVREQIEAEFAQRQNLLQQRAEQSQRKKQEF